MILMPPSSTLFPTRRSSDLRFCEESSRDSRPRRVSHEVVDRRTDDVGEDDDEHPQDFVSGAAFLRSRDDEHPDPEKDRKSTRLNSSHEWISYAVFCLKKKNK